MGPPRWDMFLFLRTSSRRGLSGLWGVVGNIQMKVLPSQNRPSRREQSSDTQKKRHSTGRAGVPWRNSRGRPLTERRPPSET